MWVTPAGRPCVVPLQFCIAALLTLYGSTGISLIRRSVESMSIGRQSANVRLCVCYKDLESRSRRTELRTSSATRRRRIATPPATLGRGQSARVNLNRDREEESGHPRLTKTPCDRCNQRLHVFLAHGLPAYVTGFWGPLDLGGPGRPPPLPPLRAGLAVVEASSVLSDLNFYSENEPPYICIPDFLMGAK